MRKFIVVSWIANVLFAVAVAYWIDFGEVLRIVQMLGFGFLAILAVRVLILCVDANSWRMLLAAEQRATIAAATLQRWIGESVSTLFPFASVSGEIARVRVACVLGLPASESAASVIVDAAVALVSQLLFLGLGVSLFISTANPDASMLRSIALGSIALLAAAAGFWLALRGGALGRFAGQLKGSLDAEGAKWLADALVEVDAEIAKIVARQSGVLAAIVWRLLGWVTGAFEITIILHLVGEPVSFAEALMLDALVSVVRTAFWFIPGGIGVQEGALLLLGASLGISSEAMLAAALVKRGREIAMSVPGILVWQGLETRGLQRSDSK